MESSRQVFMVKNQRYRSVDRIIFGRSGRSAAWTTAGFVVLGTGQALPFVKLYWFAWQAFHPETLLWP
jgi:hypothetical protein